MDLLDNLWLPGLVVAELVRWCPPWAWDMGVRDGGLCPATCTCYLWKPEIVIHLPTVEAFGFCICYFLIRRFVYL